MNNPKHKLVPLEPTEEMLDAAHGPDDGHNRHYRTDRMIAGVVYKAMIEASPKHDSDPVTEPHMYSDDYTPTQPQSSLHELAEKWPEAFVSFDSDGNHDESMCGEYPIDVHQLYELIEGYTWKKCLVIPVDELTQALAAESELRGLERDVATDGAITLLKTNSLELDDGWLRLDGPVAHHPHMKDTPEVRYLELRGLLERHPTNGTLVRLREDG